MAIVPSFARVVPSIHPGTVEPGVRVHVRLPPASTIRPGACTFGDQMKHTHQHAAVPDTPERGRARAPTTPLGGVLALQRGAGNRAVAGLLARDTKTKPKETKNSQVVVFPGIGEIPIESLQMDVQRHPGGTAGSGGSIEEARPRSLTLTSRQGDHSTQLFREALNGEAKDIEVILIRPTGTMRIKLKRALVSNYSVGSGGDQPTETWTLDAMSIEVVIGDVEKRKEPSPG